MEEKHTDGELRDASPKETSAGKKRKKPKKVLLRRILAGILTALLVALAVLVFVYRDRLDDEELRKRFGKAPSPVLTEEAFTYESGSDQVFASVGDGLAVACGSAVQLLDAEGATVWKQIVSYGAPAVFTSEEQALFCDIGGTAAVAVNMAGESAAIETGAEILTASMNENGWFVIVTEAAGYKGLVRVYNAARELQYEWWSGNGYVLRAVVSPDNRLLAALCADDEGTKLHLFRLSSDTELAAVSFPGALDFDLCFLGGDMICCLGARGAHFVGTDGEMRGEYDLGNYYLMDYAFGSDFIALFVSAYRTGTGGLLTTVDRRGELLGYAELSRNLISLSVCGKQVLALTGGDVSLYGQDMTPQNRREMLVTAKKALLQPSGNILMLSAYAAEQFRF